MKSSPVRFRVVVALTLLSFAVLSVVIYFQRPFFSSNSSAASPTLQGAAAIEHLKQQGIYASLGEAMTAARYGIHPVTDASGLGSGEYVANNAANSLRVNFAASGVELQAATATGRDWHLEMKLRNAGYGNQQTRIGSGKLAAEGNRIEYTRPLDNSQIQNLKTEIREWYVNQPSGLEQGFTLTRPPGARNGEPLQLVLALNTELQARAEADGQAVEFWDAAGTRVLRYDKLAVWDARGKALKARMSVQEEELRLEVDDAAAVYPVTIDPNFTQQAYLKASNTDAGDAFGLSLAVSGDTVVVGAPNEDSNATGVNGDQSNNFANFAGAAYVFVRNGATWSQQAYLKASNAESSDFFGWAVAISGDTVVVGAYGEDSNATGINGNQANNSLTDSGAAYVFVRNGTTWNQQAYLKASNTGGLDFFGKSVSIAGDTAVVGAEQERSNATGVNGDQNNDLAVNSGAAYVFVRNGVTWSQQAYLKASNTESNDFFGTDVAVSGDTVVIGAPVEDSGATGINGNQNDNTIGDSGAAYVFVRNSAVWSQQAYLKASNTGANDSFGDNVAISGDTVVIGAYRESSNATGVNGDQNNNAASEAGAAYVFVRSGATWSQQAYLKASNTGDDDRFGKAVAVAGDLVVVGAYQERSNATGINGDQSNNTLLVAGAVYLFTRTGVTWSQQAYLKASNTDALDAFGFAVAISGNTVVVGAYGEASNATGINGNQADNSATDSGAVYAFFAPPIVVTTLADEQNTNGQCSLREALINANNDDQSGSTDCAAGSFADTISFSVTGTITLGSALPDINTSLSINGPGASQLTISGNNAVRVFNTGSNALDVTFSGITIANGLVTSAGNALGAGIFSGSTGAGVVTVMNCVLTGNTVNTTGATSAGGAIFNNSTGTVNVISSTIAGNTATGPNRNGAGIFNNGTGSVNVTNSTLSGNTAGSGGGIYNNGGGTVTVTSSTISGNSASGSIVFGGGIFNSNAGTVNVSSSTISGNSANTNGGGIYINGVGTVNVKNSIVAGNAAGTGPDAFGAFTSQGFNLIGKSNGSTGFNATGDLTGTIAAPLDPRLGPLADNGGPTQTHGLRGDSPAIDAGTSTGIPATDGRGLGRVIDGNGDNTNVPDIGALEVQKLLVTNTNDSGVGSLRQAIVDNNSFGSGLIAFNIAGGGVKTIAPTTALPLITRMVTINGYTQPGSSANTLAVGNDAVLLIELNGTSAGAGTNGIALGVGYCDIRGLVINRFSSNGIRLFYSATAVENQITGNFIGTNPAGTIAQANAESGIFIESNNNTIGGPLPAARNVISGNGGSGILILNISGFGASGNRFWGNYIGLNAAGTAAVGNGMSGIDTGSASNNIFGGRAAGERNVVSGNTLFGIVLFNNSNNNQVLGNYVGTSANGLTAVPNNRGISVWDAANNVIGGATMGAGNLISGNNFAGVGIQGAGTTNTQVLGNMIGTNLTGTSSIANIGDGVGVFGGATGTTIGGTTTAARNIISGNTGNGVELRTNDNFVQGNYIGTDAGGTTGLPNGGNGLNIISAANNTIGGTVAGAVNIIAFNGGAGVNINSAGAINNSVLGNSIFSNSTLGVDLGNNGLTPNDAGDADTGINNLQNFPVLNFVTSGGLLGGSLDSLPVNTAYPVRIEFFANTACDALGNGEGEVYLGFVSLPAQGFFNFNFTPIAGKSFITATATDNNGNTSEFSACRQVGNAPITVNTTADTVAADGFCSLREAIQAANTNTAVNECAPGVAGLDNIIFDLGTGTPSIAVTGSALPTITEPVNINGATGGATRVELNGAGVPGAANGLTINSGGSLVTSLVINRFNGSGIVLQTAGGNSIQGCRIGTDVTGTLPAANGGNGVQIIGVSNNTIGGVTPGAGNLISRNGQRGVLITGAAATNNSVQGNFIGTNAAGTAALPNMLEGVTINGAGNNTIGGAVTEARNIISGNGNDGVLLDAGAIGNQILGNYIGTNFDGTAIIPNVNNGVDIQGGANGNTVGGTSLGARNVISGNNNNGVQIAFVGATNNQVRGNYIGTNASGTARLANSGYGVVIIDTTNNFIGGAGAGNLISGNAQGGVAISGATAMNNQVLSNLIGLNINGDTALQNDSNGVLVIGGANNTIGGTTVGAGNFISGNADAGVLLTGAGTTGNQVLGNNIGTNSTGALALGNGNGVRISGGASGNTIGGTMPEARNIISGNNTGIAIVEAASTNNQVLGNYIGTNATGTAGLNQLIGVSISGAVNNTIGGTATGAGNLISGNTSTGISISGATATGNLVQGNSIGTNALGTAALGNANGVGISNAAFANTIGGTATNARNIISGNTNLGLFLSVGATGNLVQGNFIGLRADGSTALGNGNVGVLIDQSPANTIGGTTAAARNVVSANDSNGVEISGNSAINNVVAGNFIGVNAAGTAALANTAAGVQITNAANNTIGGTAAGAGNLISGNSSAGIAVTGATATGNRLLGNG
ncbi:MAG TPA: choice-of-anchor Q domain-containing protein, partial [Blastocatellia bacterium]|nr:choice-of-anchor Q domain-containing protein [Blastocatellia bacterium]